MHKKVCIAYIRQYVIDTHVCIMCMYYNMRKTHTHHTYLYTHMILPVTASYIHTHLHTRTHNTRITHIYLRITHIYLYYIKKHAHTIEIHK